MRTAARGTSINERHAEAGCYLLHFDGAIYGAQHYLGWSVDIRRRVRKQLSGRGARLVRQALMAGLGVELVRTWPDADRKHERVLKRRGPKSQCPRCRRGRRDLYSLVLPG